MVFGCEQDGPGVQIVGDVSTRQGRLLTFPNIFQHQVQPFELADKTKPGHRKVLALFLVDPHIRIISSAHVPCQQREWWADEIRFNGALGRLPEEMVSKIVEDVEDFPIGLAEAKELRLELMEERKVFEVNHGNQFEVATFSLCEH